MASTAGSAYPAPTSTQTTKFNASNYSQAPVRQFINDLGPTVAGVPYPKPINTASTIFNSASYFLASSNQPTTNTAGPFLPLIGGVLTGPLNAPEITSSSGYAVGSSFINSTSGNVNGPLGCGAITSTGAFTCGTNSAAMGSIVQSSTGTIQTGNIPTGAIRNRLDASCAGFNPLSHIGFYASTIPNGCVPFSSNAIGTIPTLIHTFSTGNAGVFLVSIIDTNTGYPEIHGVSLSYTGNILYAWFVSSPAGSPSIVLSGANTVNLLATAIVALNSCVSLTRIM
jgi:hypothetical protein